LRDSIRLMAISASSIGVSNYKPSMDETGQRAAVTMAWIFSRSRGRFAWAVPQRRLRARLAETGL